MLCEIGGTVGDIESLPFLEAIRQLGNELGRERALFVHLTLVPWIPSAGELKTKPTQHSVKELLGLGIQPDILLCRCDRPIPRGRAQEDRAVLQSARTAGDPGARRRHHLRGARRLSRRGLRPRGAAAISASPRREPDLGALARDRRRASASPRARSRSPSSASTRICSTATNRWPRRWRMAASPTTCRSSSTGSTARSSSSQDAVQRLEGVHGILVPGGFGERGAEGKIEAARFARERSVPYFGICFGMQMAVIEAARHLAGLARRRLDRVRPVRRAGGRPDDRMDARQRARAARGGRRSRRHHAAGRLRGGAGPRAAASPRSTARRASASATATATRSTSTTRSGWSDRLALLRHVARRRAARDRRDPRSSLVHRRAVSIPS